MFTNIYSTLFICFLANDSGDDQPPWEYEAIRIVSLVSLIMYCVIFVLGLLGNSLVIYVTGYRMKRTVNSVWFLNLALADFLCTIFLIFSIISLSQNNTWNFGRIMCKLNNFVTVVNMFASIFLLTAISLDRCLSIWVVVWAQNHRTVHKAQVISSIIWVMAVACSIPFATYRDVLEIEGMTFCTYTRSYPGQSLMVFRFVMGFLVPFLVICVSYVAIAVRAGRLQRNRRRRSRRIIFAVVLAFFICWLPFHVMQFLQFSSPDFQIYVQIGGSLSVCLAYLNSCLNPILYVFMCDEFQKKLKQSICLVLESALAEDHLTFMSSRSLSSQLSRISRKSDTTTPSEAKGPTAKFKFTECKDFSVEDKDSELC